MTESKNQIVIKRDRALFHILFWVGLCLTPVGFGLLLLLGTIFVPKKAYYAHSNVPVPPSEIPPEWIHPHTGKLCKPEEKPEAITKEVSTSSKTSKGALHLFLAILVFLLAFVLLFNRKTETLTETPCEAAFREAASLLPNTIHSDLFPAYWACESLDAWRKADSKYEVVGDAPTGYQVCYASMICGYEEDVIGSPICKQAPPLSSCDIF